MEIASTFIATITPPPYQKGTEEARRDANNRQEIPQPKDTQQSGQTGVPADSRGGTSGTNSQLYAQAEAITNVNTEQVQGRNGRRKGSVSNDRGKDTKNRKTSAQGTEKTSASAGTGRARTGAQLTAGSTGGQAISASASLTAALGGSAGAQFDASITGQLGSDNALRTSVIAGRYNRSSSFYLKGGNLNLNA